MLYFSTEFPLRRSTSQQDLLNECLNWVLDSPHTSFAEENLKQFRDSGEFRRTNSGEIIEYDSATSDTYLVGSFRYTKRASNVQYVTTISFLIMRVTGEVWAGVKVVCESIGVVDELPALKKPVIIRRLIDRFGGGLDGDLHLSGDPSILSDDEAGYDFAISIITAKLSCRLPVVYISCGYDGRHRLIPGRLASWLCGLAHVVVEPSRKFSHRIREQCSSQNVFGGVIGVYWPGGNGVKTYRFDKNWYASVKAFEGEIIDDICSMLSKRMPLAECSWGGVQDVKNKSAIERLRIDGASDRELIELYQIEVDQYREKVESLAGENRRLEALLRSAQEKSPVQGGIVLSSGDEEDYYDNEILSVIIQALTDYKSRVHTNSRRQHIVDSLLSSNQFENEADRTTREIKESLRGYRAMTPKIRASLESLGFEILDDRKHVKIVYRSDERYTYTLPKTGSDHRGGLNASSDIIRLIF